MVLKHKKLVKYQQHVVLTEVHPKQCFIKKCKIQTINRMPSWEKNMAASTQEWKR